TWIATDKCGNSISASQTITVVDATRPTLSGQGGPLTVSCPASPVFTAPTASDNCDPAPKITFSDSTPVAGNCAGAYSITRTWVATDACGNVSLPVSQTITVVDTTKPILVGVPADANASCDSVPAAAAVSATDECDPAPKVTLVETSTQDADASKCGHYT